MSTDNDELVALLAAEFGLPTMSHALIFRAAKGREGAGGAIKEIERLLALPCRSTNEAVVERVRQLVAKEQP